MVGISPVVVERVGPEGERASHRDPPGEGRVDACSDQERVEGGPGDPREPRLNRADRAGRVIDRDGDVHAETAGQRPWGAGPRNLDRRQSGRH